MLVKIPTIRSSSLGFANLAKISAEAFHARSTHVDFDFSGCGFFDANMAAPFKAVLCKVVDGDNSIDLVGLPTNIEKILRKNEFLCDFGHRRMFDSNSTVLPFRGFTTSDLKNFASYLDQYLKGKGIPKMSDGLVKKFRQSIFEIFENCVMHSHSSSGVYVCGQYYPKEEHLDLTISDVGVGIRTNVRKFLNSEISSADAIQWAMIEGNTTKTGSQPGGFGLKLLQEFIELNKGKVHIASRDGYYEFSGGTKKFLNMPGDFPGTTINFEINTSDQKSYRLKSEVTAKNIF